MATTQQMRTAIGNYLRFKGLPPTTENLNRASAALARNPELVAGFQAAQPEGQDPFELEGSAADRGRAEPRGSSPYGARGRTGGAGDGQAASTDTGDGARGASAGGGDGASGGRRAPISPPVPGARPTRREDGDDVAPVPGARGGFDIPWSEILAGGAAGAGFGLMRGLGRRGRRGGDTRSGTGADGGGRAIAGPFIEGEVLGPDRAGLGRGGTALAPIGLGERRVRTPGTRGGAVATAEPRQFRGPATAAERARITEVTPPEARTAAPGEVIITEPRRHVGPRTAAEQAALDAEVDAATGVVPPDSPEGPRGAPAPDEDLSNVGPPPPGRGAVGTADEVAASDVAEGRAEGRARRRREADKFFSGMETDRSRRVRGVERARDDFLGQVMGQAYGDIEDEVAETGRAGTENASDDFVRSERYMFQTVLNSDFSDMVQQPNGEIVGTFIGAGGEPFDVNFNTGDVVQGGQIVGSVNETQLQSIFTMIEQEGQLGRIAGSEAQDALSGLRGRSWRNLRP